MNMHPRLRQIRTIAAIELRRAFFSRRTFWIYALALFPSLIFFAYSMGIKWRKAQFSSIPRISAAQMDGVQKGESIDAVLSRLGSTPRDIRTDMPAPPDEPLPPDEKVSPPAPRTLTPQEKTPPRSVRTLVYFDGRREAVLVFNDGELTVKSVNVIADFEDNRRVFAGVFRLYYLRLAVFFGCLGIFMNLFRGEMLDKTLHFWFLAPARREALLLGKYGAGLTASSVIFVSGALIAFGLMLSAHDAREVGFFWREAGAAHIFWYAASAFLGCIGYGSVFLAAGLFLRNPIIPAAVLLAWEGIGSFLPETAQRVSILYYLQSLCPVMVPPDEGLPPLLSLLMTPVSPASRTGAVLGLSAIAAGMLWLAGKAVRRMQISYDSES